MTALPSEEALRRMRRRCSDAIESDEGRDTVSLATVESRDLAALLNCALTVRELERWMLDDIHGPLRAMHVSTGNEVGVSLQTGSVEIGPYFGPDLLTALRAALAKASEVSK